MCSLCSVTAMDAPQGLDLSGKVTVLLLLNSTDMLVLPHWTVAEDDSDFGSKWLV